MITRCNEKLKYLNHTATVSNIYKTNFLMCCNIHCYDCVKPFDKNNNCYFDTGLYREIIKHRHSPIYDI